MPNSISNHSTVYSTEFYSVASANVSNEKLDGGHEKKSAKLNFCNQIRNVDDRQNISMKKIIESGEGMNKK